MATSENAAGGGGWPLIDTWARASPSPEGLRLSLDPAYPEADWGFTAQQAVEKLFKAWIVLADRQPPRVHHLEDLLALAGQQVDPLLLELQVFAVEARDVQGPFPLPAPRQKLLALVEAELDRCQRAAEALADSAG